MYLGCQLWYEQFSMFCLVMGGNGSCAGGCDGAATAGATDSACSALILEMMATEDNRSSTEM